MANNNGSGKQTMADYNDEGNKMWIALSLSCFMAASLKTTKTKTIVLRFVFVCLAFAVPHLFLIYCFNECLQFRFVCQFLGLRVYGCTHFLRNVLKIRWHCNQEVIKNVTEREIKGRNYKNMLLKAQWYERKKFLGIGLQQNEEQL